MEQHIIDQLMEIKKLYEAGILTKEEMEAEKAKVLHPTTVVPKNNEEQIAPCDVPQQAISNNNNEEQIDSADVPHLTISDNNNKEPKSEVLKNRVWFLVGSVVVILIFFVTISQNGKCSSSQTYDDYVIEDPDTIAVVEDADEEVAMDYGQEQTSQNYDERAEEYISGLDTETRVVAILTDDERHCVYTLTEFEAGWGRLNSLYCHNLETGSTNLVIVPYKVAGEEDNGEQVADAKMVGNNLYVINTSYRCGSSVACLNTYTGNWSCQVRACADAKFDGSNKLKVTYSELVYEGECLADNQYEYTDKTITLK